MLLRRVALSVGLGDVVFRHACQLGFEGNVSKRLGSPYVSGRTRHWLKFKNPAAVSRQSVSEIHAGNPDTLSKAWT